MCEKDVWTLEQLKENFNINDAVKYFNDGTLARWLKVNKSDDEAEKIQSLSKNDPNIKFELCKIFDIPVIPSTIEELLAQAEREYADKNFEKALELYKKAADFDNVDAMYKLADMYYYGESVDKDLVKASEYYKKAADNGHVEAMIALAGMYYNGKGGEEDLVKAREYFKKAADNGHVKAMSALAYMYYNGEGGDKDLVKAREYYKKAADKGDIEAKSWLKQNPENSSNDSDSICFITTAVCDILNKSDNCRELTAFRNFRDTWLINQPDGKDLISMYYEIAPKIVAEINKLPSAKNIYQAILSNYLQPCLKLIESGENFKCKNIYIEMVNSLKEKFLT